MIDNIGNYKKSWSILKTYHVGIVGATTLIGQYLLLLLENHPWFKVTSLADTSEFAGKSYPEAVGNNWMMNNQIPSLTQNMILWDSSNISSIIKMSNSLDFVFCALNFEDEDSSVIEEEFARSECPIISCNSASSFASDIPLIIPEVNPEHAKIIVAQRERLGTRRGFIAASPSCSSRSFVPILSAFSEFNIDKTLVCVNKFDYNGFESFTSKSQSDSKIIYDESTEEKKINHEPLKIWGRVRSGEIVLNHRPYITSQCVGFSNLDSQVASVFVSFRKSYGSIENLVSKVNIFNSLIQYSNLPSSPSKLINYLPENEKPHLRFPGNLNRDMSISLGEISTDFQYDIKFVSALHNPIKSSAKGTVLLAELLSVQGYLS